MKKKSGNTIVGSRICGFVSAFFSVRHATPEITFQVVTRHVLVIRVRSAREARTNETSPSTIAKPNPSASACQSQPVMIRLRTHSIMYETGFSVAAMRNQSTPMRLRGVFIDEMNRKTKSTGKSAWIVSPEPVRYASHAPSAPKRERDDRAVDEQDGDPGRARLEADACRQPDGDVEHHLHDAEHDDPRELAGEERPVAQRGEREPVDEARLDVARDVGARVHRREERTLDERHGEREREERVGRETRKLVDARRPPAFTAMSATGKISGGMMLAG